MDDVVAKTMRWKSCNKEIVRIFVSIVIVFMLIWILQTGYILITKPIIYVGDKGTNENGYLALVFGAATVVFGMVYFIVGLTIVGELVLDFLGWLRGEDVKFMHCQEKKVKSQVYIQAATTIMSIFMFAWAMLHGCKIAAGAPKGGIHNCLTFVIGFTTISFGFVYFIIGISIVAESALYLSGRLQPPVVEKDIINDDQNEDDGLLPV